MRSTPRIIGNIVTTLAAASELSVLEDEDKAKAKISVSGAWIHVQDGDGNKGYVAAWLVVLSLDDIPAPEPVEACGSALKGGYAVHPPENGPVFKNKE